MRCLTATCSSAAGPLRARLRIQWVRTGIACHDVEGLAVSNLPFQQGTGRKRASASDAHPKRRERGHLTANHHQRDITVQNPSPPATRRSRPPRLTAPCHHIAVLHHCQRRQPLLLRSIAAHPLPHEGGGRWRLRGAGCYQGDGRLLSPIETSGFGVARSRFCIL